MLKTLRNSVRILFTTLFIFSFSINVSEAQESSQIVETYKAYTTPAREVVYLHLNKSTYISGEPIGFTAYVLDKKSKQPSFITTNLYVSIEDKNKTVLKQKLIKVTDGVASNTFEVDSTFSSGNYKIKAYTNWMLNFDEKNYFSESIRILNPDNENDLSEKRIDNKIDAQFLPESGHLLNGVVNIIGVVIKDQLGFGIPYAKGNVVDKNNEVLTSFETNQFGIGKFQLLPEFGNHYNINITNNNKDFSFLLNHKIENEGVLISLKSLKSKVFVSLITNEKTLETIKNKKHSLMIHNGDEFNIKDIYFTDNTEITTTIEYNNVATGVNTLTLFNDNDQPIAERLFFNYEGIHILKSHHITAKKTKDSVSLNLNFKTLNPNTFNTLSVSVLPQETKSYNRHHNMLSYTFLEPYVNGTIEQAKYYFTDIDDRKKYELDNLLLTQGWSSYNWDKIYKTKSQLTHAFEQGITIKANLTEKDLNDSSDLNFVLHAINNESPRILNVQRPDKSFLIENIFPEDNNQLNLSKVTENKGLQPAKLYLQYFPRIIPQLKDEKLLLSPKTDYKLKESFDTHNTNFILNSPNVQQLKEVTLTTKLDKKLKRIEELSFGRFGEVKVVNEEDIRSYLTLNNYLMAQGLLVTESSSMVNTAVQQENIALGNNVGSPRLSADNGDDLSQMIDDNGLKVSTYSGGVFAIFLNDMRLIDTSILNRYDLSQIDYIEINRFAIGEGMRGSSGVLRLYTKFKNSKAVDKKTVNSFKVPLAFSPEKKYYTPKYRNTGDSFYKSYGVVDWKTFTNLDRNNNVNLKIASPSMPITLYIEGITNAGSFIFEEKIISIN
ncbi:hypothetical protein [Winogradskyella helgolandensis]|uniref:hypothetical protein n=1 Tax=Winogradskyella helgolandensis TaxID=2697010 RepID=UPI0015CB1975|nr:hypothetical protein [Winogradskyella helgolandensis]